MAGELPFVARLTNNKTGVTPGSGDISASLDTAETNGHGSSQDLTADTIEALAVGDVAAPAGMILVKLVTPASGTNVEISLKNSTDFDAYRFAVLTKKDHVALWSPKQNTTIYVKAIGAAAKIFTVAG